MMARDPYAVSLIKGADDSEQILSCRLFFPKDHYRDPDYFLMYLNSLRHVVCTFILVISDMSPTLHSF